MQELMQMAKHQAEQNQQADKAYVDECYRRMLADAAYGTKAAQQYYN